MSGLISRRRLLLAVIVIAGSAHVPLPAVAGSAESAPPCDFDSDGYGDLAVGAPGATESGKSGAGRVAVFVGSDRGLGDAPSLNLAAGSGLAGSPRPNAGLGSVTACGDFNGDDHADLAIGAPGERVAGEAGAGAVYLIYGGPSGLDVANTARITARSNGIPGDVAADANFGWALVALDRNGDGKADLAVGAPGAASVTVVLGSDNGLNGKLAYRYVDQGLQGLGFALGAGDINGDGLLDLVAGAPGMSVGGRSNAGGIATWFGGSATLESPTVITHDTIGVKGEARKGARMGQSVAIADLDRDGLDDITTGAPGYRIGSTRGAGDVVSIYVDESGAVVRSTRLNLNKLGLEPAAFDRFGWSVAAGDLNGQGPSELLIGVPRRDGDVSDAGMLVMASHNLASVPTDLGLVPAVGAALSATLTVGDFDGNGRADIAAGLPGQRIGSDDRAGAVALIYGRAQLHLGPPVARPGAIFGSEAGDSFGALGVGQVPRGIPVASFEMLSRDEWQARDPIVARLAEHNIERITIHHAGDQTVAKGPAVYRGWQEWHMDGHDWGDVAYHIIIGWDGRVFAARPKRFAGDTGTNYDPAGHLLIVVEGNFNEHHPTAAQLEMLPKVTAWAAELYDADLSEISGHRDHAATTCPGDYLYGYIESGGLSADVGRLIDFGGVVVSR